MSSRGCTCTRVRRAWQPDGICATCGQNVLEDQLIPALLQILCGGTGLVLWRNNAGLNTHWPTGERRKAPIRYGVGTPGGADYIGLWRTGRFVGVEFKTQRGTQEPDQVAFEALVVRQNGIYALVRTERDAVELLGRLRGEADQ